MRIITRAAALCIAGGVALAFASWRAPAQSPREAPPTFTQPVLFNTPQADRIVRAMQIFPPDNPWNQDISAAPAAANSAAMIAKMNPNGRMLCDRDMGFVLVPPDQKKVNVKITAYAGESDKGPYPIPDNAPIEGWPMDGKTLDDIQRHGGGDRHVLVVDPVHRLLYEFYAGRKTDAGWEAAQASIFDLSSNRLRPDGWTSSDAAGLPVFPAVVRYDEVERGMVNHAMRVTFVHTRRAFVHPATHFASKLRDADLPRMGERLRLRADFDATGFSPHAQAIVKGLKKYGMIVADNGSDWFISVTPDERIKGLEDMRKVHGRDFEVVTPRPAK